jgi:hypothetical protein
VDSAELSQTGEDISSRRLIRAERRIDDMLSLGSAVSVESVCVCVVRVYNIVYVKSLSTIYNITFFGFGLE